MRTKKLTQAALPPMPVGVTELTNEALDHVAGGRASPIPGFGASTAELAFPYDKQREVYAHGAPPPLGAFVAGYGVQTAGYTPGGGPY